MQPTPRFLPGKCHGQRRLVGYSPQDSKESDTTEQLTLSLSFLFPNFFIAEEAKGPKRFSDCSKIQRLAEGSECRTLHLAWFLYKH